MNAGTFDSLQFVRILRDKGRFTTEQAESIADAMASTLHDDLATKGTLRETESRLEGNLRETELRLEGALRESELRLEARIAETKSDIIKWMFGTIGFQTIVMIGAIIALAHVAR